MKLSFGDLWRFDPGGRGGKLMTLGGHKSRMREEMI